MTMNRSWNIRDASGNVVAIHERIDQPDGGKRFLWRQPDGSMGLGGRSLTELPLYGSERLPDAELVVVCEGEKAADAAFSAGFASAGTVTGAASAPGPAALSVLLGHPVVLWPDADAVGQGHMERVGLRLLELGASDLRMVPQNGHAPGSDAADLSMAEVVATVNEAPAWQPDSSLLRRDDPDAREFPAPMSAVAYRGLLGELVGAVAPHTEAAPEALLGTWLAVLGVLCAGPIFYQGGQHGANLFVALVGETSHGRKGTALGVVSRLLDECHPDWQKLVVPGLGSGEGLIGHLKRTEDADPRALLRETEMGRMLVAMSREGNVISPIMRDAWDRSPIGRVLAREEMIVYRHHVGMLGHITPVELRARLTALDTANGFGNRILWLAVRRPHLISIAPDPVQYVPPVLLTALRATIDAGELVREIDWSFDAAAAWDAMYQEHEAQAVNRHGLFAALTARAMPQMMRLALLYAILDRADEIEPAHLEAASAVWDYVIASCRWVWGESTGSSDADALLRILRLAGVGLSREELRAETGMRKAADIDDAVTLLVEAGLARQERVATGRRPKLVVIAR